jgi:hypothetical protein
VARRAYIIVSTEKMPLLAPLVGVLVTHRSRWSAVALLLGCAPGAIAAQTASLPDWVTVDSAGRTVSLALEARPGGPDGITTLSGHHHGDIQLVVPAGWTVRWTWVNQDSTRNHSLVVMAEREKLPAEGGRPALDNALSRSVTAGLRPGQWDVTTFVADQPGWYWMLCGVPNHALQGEWIGLKVDREAGTVGVNTKR